MTYEKPEFCHVLESILGAVRGGMLLPDIVARYLPRTIGLAAIPQAFAASFDAQQALDFAHNAVHLPPCYAHVAMSDGITAFFCRATGAIALMLAAVAAANNCKESTRAAPPRTADASSAPVAAKLAVVIGRERETVTTSEQATRVFQIAWNEEVVPTSTGKAQLVRDHTDAVLLPGRRPWSAPARASLGPCRAAGVEVSEMLKATVSPEAVLYSAPAALERDGNCWQITFQEHIDSVVGYLDARTGSLLFVYLVGEG